jgi:chemotaxis protein CheD
MNKFYLLPGAFFADRKPHTIDTILGSCIAVVLWDSVLRIGSINHFMLPKWNGEGTPSYKYGDVAIAGIIQKMVQMGSKKVNLKAKVFGGSFTYNANGIFQIGQRNIDITFELLKEANIPVVSQSVGGSLSRKVVFHSDTGDVLVKFMGISKPATVPHNKLNINRL